VRGFGQLGSKFLMWFRRDLFGVGHIVAYRFVGNFHNPCKTDRKCRTAARFALDYYVTPII
jgi:hypothetical protein